MRNGIGFLRSVGGSVKIKAVWENDRPKGKAIFENSGLFTAIVPFKDGVPSGEFSYHFPASLITLKGIGKLLDE